MIDQIKKYFPIFQRACNIIVLSGAGISTSAGIPDFRSPKTGLYHNLEKYNLPYPEAIFDIDYFLQNPKPFFELAKELTPGKYQPTVAHRFIRIIEEEGKLCRNYTQNIDGLEQAANIEKVIECHGTFQTATCLICKKPYTLEDIKETILAGKVPSCTCSPNSIIKPDVVFFKETLPREFFSSIPVDFPKCDLLLVMGTSLNVYPVAGLINEAPLICPILYINKTPPPLSFQSEINSLLGECDPICSLLSQKLFGRAP